MALDLVVGDLRLAADATAAMRELRLPALEKWLARADILRVETGGTASWLAAAFGLGVPAPIAPIALAGESRVPEGAWLRADPVHLRIDRDRSSIHAAAQLDIAREEADALIRTLGAHFRTDGLELVAPAPDRWYLRVPPGDWPETTPLDEAIGMDARRLLPVSRGRLNWAGLLTEAQMLLSTDEVNVRRERAARPPINSVWLWGGGELPARVASDYRAVYSSDAFARGLGTLSEARVADVPPTLRELRAQPPDELALVVIDTLTRQVQRGDSPAWIDAARALDRDWFEGMGEAIGRLGGVRLVLPGARDTIVASLGTPARRRWFRRRVPLASYA